MPVRSLYAAVMSKLASPRVCQGCGTGVPGNCDFRSVSHCGSCPPQRCDDCGEMDSAAQPCPCWSVPCPEEVAGINAERVEHGGWIDAGDGSLVPSGQPCKCVPA